MRAALLPPIVALAAATRSAAAEDAAVVIEERVVIATIESGDPRIERIAAGIDDAAAAVEAARVRPEPRIAIDREEVFPPGGGLATDYLRFVIPLDVSGRRGRRIAAAERVLGAARATSEIDRFALVVEAVRVFREAAYLRLRVSLMTTERAALLRAVDIVTKRARAGEASGYDQQRLQLELGAYDDALASAAIELRAAQRRLGTLVGRPGTRVDAAGELGLPTRAAALEMILPDALARRGDYRAAQLRVEAAAAERAAADRTWVPVVELTGGPMSADLGTRTATGYVAGLAFNVPIFDRGAAARARADAARRAATADARWLERQIPDAIRIAHDTWTARIEQARAFQANQLARLDQLLRSAEAGYRDGAASIIELLDAYRSARDARLRDLELRRDASLAELDLWLALGRQP
jgi:cobalt-zinc-cadmium efflux system outer membrane protein